MEDQRLGPDEVFLLLAKAVPSLPSHVFEMSAEEIARQLSHAERQTLIVAVQALAPHVVHEAFAGGFSGNDLLAWVGELSTTGGELSSSADLPPRGSYLSSNTRLRVIRSSDIDFLYEASLEPRSAHRWRYRGRTPSPSEFYDQVYDPAVLAQFMVEQVAPAGPVGAVIGYDADRVAGHCKIAIQRLLERDAVEGSRGLMIPGFLIFAQYLFDHFNFRKLYVEVPEYNLSLFSGGVGSILVEEGRLRGHVHFGDRAWDLFYLALYRESWDAAAESFRGSWPEGHFDSHPGFRGHK